MICLVAMVSLGVMWTPELSRAETPSFNSLKYIVYETNKKKKLKLTIYECME